MPQLGASVMIAIDNTKAKKSWAYETFMLQV